MHRHAGNQRKLHIRIDLAVSGDRIVELSALLSGQMISLDLCHTLQILQHLLNQFFIGVDLFPRQLAGSLLQPGVRIQEQGKACQQHQSDPPVKEQQHDDDQAGRQHAFTDQHDHAGRHIFQAFHHIRCN